MILHLDDKMFNTESIAKLQEFMEVMGAKTSTFKLLADLVQELDDQNSGASTPFEDIEDGGQELANKLYATLDGQMNEILDKVYISEEDGTSETFIGDCLEYIGDNTKVLNVMEGSWPIESYELHETTLNRVIKEANQGKEDVPQWVKDSEEQADLFGAKLCEQHENNKEG
jgi:hypothetical protein